MMALETISMHVRERLVFLLKNAITNGFLAENMAQEGFKRVEETMDDLVKDVPAAKENFSKICAECKDLIPQICKGKPQSP